MEQWHEIRFVGRLIGDARVVGPVERLAEYVVNLSVSVREHSKPGPIFRVTCINDTGRIAESLRKGQLVRVEGKLDHDAAGNPRTRKAQSGAMVGHFTVSAYYLELLQNTAPEKQTEPQDG